MSINFRFIKFFESSSVYMAFFFAHFQNTGRGRENIYRLDGAMKNIFPRHNKREYFRDVNQFSKKARRHFLPLSIMAF